MAERLKDFDSAELVHAEAEALLEARRFLDCGRGAEVIDRKCIRCLTCIRCCPFAVPYMKDRRSFPRTSASPAGFALPSARPSPSLSGRLDPRETCRQVAEISRKGHQEVIFACLRGITSREELQAPETVWWDCLKILQPEDLLAPFELGATALLLKECREDCRLDAAGAWFHGLVGHTNETLTPVGLGPRCALPRTSIPV